MNKNERITALENRVAQLESLYFEVKQKNNQLNAALLMEAQQRMKLQPVSWEPGPAQPDAPETTSFIGQRACIGLTDRFEIKPLMDGVLHDLSEQLDMSALYRVTLERLPERDTTVPSE